MYTRLTARRNLLYWAALYRVPTPVARRRVDALLDRVGLAGRADERVETFSRGMKQRPHLARGLVGDPRVVILDEPTTGLDPVAAHEFRALVGELRTEGRTVLLATHDMDEAEAVCDRVTLIDDGRLLRTEDPRTIGRWLAAYERVEAVGVPEELAAALRDLPLGLISLSTYCLGLALAGWVLRAMQLRNIVGNLLWWSLALLGGVQVPTAFWPSWAEHLATVLPVYHGLTAIRTLLDGGPAGTVWRHTGAEILVAAGWFVLAVLTFDRLARRGRADGSIEFAD